MKKLLVLLILIFSMETKSTVIFVGENISKKTIEFAQEVLRELKPIITESCDIYVTIGSDGLVKALDNNTSPILATYITRGEFNYIINKYPTKLQRQVGAVFWEADINSQYFLLRKFFQTGRVVAFYSENTEELRESFTDITWIAFEQDIFSSLEKIPEDTVAVLAIPDPAIFDKASLRPILKYLLNKNLPLFGYTRLMVENGALASSFPSNEDYKNAVVNNIQYILRDHDPKQVWAKVSQVKFNKLLARSLDISLPNKIEIEKALENGAPFTKIEGEKK